MSVSRRRFLETLGVAGVTLPATHWMFSALKSYAEDRLGFSDIRGPGITSFSRSVCRDCANHCSLAVRKVDGLPVGLRGTPWHPSSKGALCIAGQTQLQALFDPERLRTALVRLPPGDDPVPTEASVARELLQARINHQIATGKQDALVIIDGRTPSLSTLLLQSWTQSIPGATYVPWRIEGTLDSLARDFLGGAPGGRLCFDIENSGTLLLSGAEILDVEGSPVSQMRLHGRRRGSSKHGQSPTIYIGPRRSLTAIKSDYWLACPPETEREILLGLAEALSKTHPQRESIFPKYARWIPEARDRVEFARSHSLSNIRQRLHLDHRKIEKILDSLRHHAPAVSLPGSGLLRRIHGAEDARAAFALNLWTGGFAESGGLSWRGDPLFDVASELGIAVDRQSDSASIHRVLRSILEFKHARIETLVCVTANILHEFPGQDQIKRGLRQIPFIASFSAREDETSKHANVAFPLPLELESWDLPAPAWGISIPAIQIQRPAVVPVVKASSIDDLILNFASEGTAGKSFKPRFRDGKELTHAAIDVIMKQGQGKCVDRRGITALQDTRAAKARHSLLTGEAMWIAPTLPGPRSRVSLPAIEASLREHLSMAPNQLQLVLFDSPASQQGRILNRPMAMELSGMLRGIAWNSWIELHPDDAHALKIHDGQSVRIRGPRAEIVTTAVIARSVVRGTAAFPVGFGHEAYGTVATGRGASAFRLPNAALDPETAVPAWGPVRVFVEKV